MWLQKYKPPKMPINYNQIIQSLIISFSEKMRHEICDLLRIFLGVHALSPDPWYPWAASRRHRSTCSPGRSSSPSRRYGARRPTAGLRFRLYWTETQLVYVLNRDTVGLCTEQRHSWFMYWTDEQLVNILNSWFMYWTNLQLINVLNRWTVS